MKTLKTVSFIMLFIIMSNLSWGQTTVFSDDFEANVDAALIQTGQIGTSPWIVNSTNSWSARRNTVLDLNNGPTWGVAGPAGGGWVYAAVPLSGFKSPYNVKLGSNPGIITWTFNMRTNRSTAGNGFGNAWTGTAITEWYANALILATTEHSEALGEGYAVVEHRPIEGTDSQAPVQNSIALIKFTGGIRGTRTTIIGFGPALAATRNWSSVKVTYDPKTNKWELFSRDDLAYPTPVVDPESGVLPPLGVATVDNSYTSITMKYLGAYGQGSYTSGRTYHFDNIKVKVNTATDVENSNSLPTEYELNQNYPNPFNPSTTIEYALPSSGFYTLKVYDLLGQQVAELLNKEMTAGTYKINFNPTLLASGTYIYTLAGNNTSISKKLVFLK